MLEIKPEIIEIILLDKKYKNKEDEIDDLIVKIYNLYNEITDFSHIDFNTIDENRLDDFNYTTTKEQRQRIESLHSNYDDNLINTILGIFSIIDNMQTVSNDLEEHRSINYDLKLMEHDINNTEKQINILKTLLEKSKIIDNENDIFRFDFSINIFELFKRDKTNALAIFKIFFTSMFSQLSLSPLEEEKLKIFKKKIETNMDKPFDERILKNIDYFYDIYCLINGYLLNSKKIYKSSALRIYNLVNDNLNINKKPLSDKVSHLFARLGIDINLDYRKAHSIRKISIYHDYTIYDYSTNKKDTDLYLSEFEIVSKIFEGLKPKLEKMDFSLNEAEMNKKAFYLSNIEAFQNNYKKMKYIID